MSWAVLADAVVILHAAYVGFVVFGFAAILVGVALGCPRRNYRSDPVRISLNLRSCW